MGLINEPKAFASLSSGLLARKGAAKPAMRPQGFGQMGASLEDLGWNDMGFEAPKPTVQERDAEHDAFGESFAEQPVRNPVSALTPSPVHGQQAEIAQRMRAAEDDEDGEEAEEEFAVVDPVAPPADLVAVEAAPIVETDPVEAQAEQVAQAEPALPLAPQVTAPATPVAVAPRAERGSGAKAAFTLRLDTARHLRLRLACALTGRSAQMLVTEAVDALLHKYPELENFAGSLPDGGHSRRAKG